MALSASLVCSRGLKVWVRVGEEGLQHREEETPRSVKPVRGKQLAWVGNCTAVKEYPFLLLLASFLTEGRQNLAGALFLCQGFGLLAGSCTYKMSHG